MKFKKTKNRIVKNQVIMLYYNDTLKLVDNNFEVLHSFEMSLKFGCRLQNSFYMPRTENDNNTSDNNTDDNN